MRNGKRDVKFLSFFLISSVFSLMVLMPAVVLAQQRTLRVESAAWVLKKFPVREAAKRFAKDHPEIKVEVTSKPAEEMTKAYLLEWGRGKTTIDVVLDETPTKMAPLVGADLLVDLSDMLVGSMAKDKFIPAALEDAHFVKKDGTSFYPMLPFTAEVMALNINKQIYEKAGLLDQSGNAVPANDWEEFTDQLRKLKKFSPGPALSVDWGWNFTLYSYAGGIQAMKGSIYAHEMLDVESWAAEKWLRLNQKWIEEGLASAGTLTDVNYGRNNYKAGIIPAIYTSHSRFIEAGAILGEKNVSMVAIPGSTKNGSVLFITPILVPKVSPNIDLAKQFIREQIFSKWFQQWDYNRYGKLPVMPAYYGEGLTWYQREATQLVKICESSTFLPKYKGNEELLDVFIEELAKLFVGRETPEKALENIREKIKIRDIDLTRLD